LDVSNDFSRPLVVELGENDDRIFFSGFSVGLVGMLVCAIFHLMDVLVSIMLGVLPALG